jgi:hypothetical protein
MNYVTTTLKKPADCKSLAFLTTNQPSGYLFKMNKNQTLSKQDALQLLPDDQSVDAFISAFED